MPFLFVVPGPLREFAGNRGEVRVRGAASSVGEALALLWQECPGARDRVLTELGDVRAHVNIFVDGENIRHAGGLSAAVRDGAEIVIVPAVSGGEPVMGRRDFISMTAAGVVMLNTRKETRMYGLIGKMNAVAGQREALIAILLEGTAQMPGCLSYIIARDPTAADGIWITEVWASEEHHKASLSLPAVQAAIAKGRPMIAGFGERFITTPVGGVGLGEGKQ